jgi:hypothetical protein
MIIELVLTVGLAGIVYLEGEVSSKLAVIKGNTLYSRSLERLSERSLVWFNEQFSVKLANKFNHVRIELFRTTNRSSLLGTSSWLYTKT